MVEGKAIRPARLRAEFVILFVAVPAAHIVFFDSLGPFLPLVAVFAVSCALLTVTPGFRWFEVVDGRGLLRQAPLILGLTILGAAVIFGLVLALMPERLFGFPRHSPARYATVMALYPFLSVLGQEIAYRLLFFRRYRGLFPNDASAIIGSALVFSFAHGFYQNWLAITLTFLGGLVFAWAYARTASFPLVWILHSLAGQILFTSGLGTYFYHGAIPG